MLDLALCGDQAPVSVQTIARRQEIPPPYLEKLLMELRRAGLVQSVRGARGGYQLARDPSEIFLGQIFRALGEPIALRMAHESGTESGDDRAEDWVTVGVWNCLAKQLSEALDRISLAELYYDARSWQATRGNEGGFMV